MEYINDKMIKPIIIGGVITGVLTFIFSLTPIVGCCCCILYVLSGIITAHLLTQEYLPSDRDYLISGALSGGVAGFVSWLLYTSKEILYSLLHNTLSMSYMMGLGDHYTSALYAGMSIMNFIIFAIFLLIGFFISLLLGTAFGAIGAILYRIVAEEIMKR